MNDLDKINNMILDCESEIRNIEALHNMRAKIVTLQTEGLRAKIDTLYRQKQIAEEKQYAKNA